MYIGLPSLGLRSSSAGFSPASLFAAGEQGGWYDPSDISTMFQDSAGTTAVAIEQPVGLILDKRAGLALGANTGPASTFTGGEWTLGSGFTVSASKLVITAATAGAGAQRTSGTIYTIAGGTQYLSVTVDSISGGTLNIAVGNTSFTVTAPGTYTARLSPAASNYLGVIAATGTVTGAISNITVQSLAGNHLIQATAASRPTLSARYNKLSHTQAFSDAAWVKQTSVSVTDNTTVAPDGTTTAATVTWGAAAFATGILQSASVAWTGVSNTKSIWVKADVGGVTVELVDPALTAGSSILTLTTSWQKVSLTEAAQTNSAGVWLRKTASTPATVYIWGAELRTAADAALAIPAYQRVDTATSYDTSGFPMYLNFDGVDDGLASAAVVTLSGTSKATACLGLTKSVDPAEAEVFSSNGAVRMEICSPDFQSAGGNKGFSAQVFNTAYATTYISGAIAPASRVVTGIIDNTTIVAGSQVVLRLNGVAGGTNIVGGATAAFSDANLYFGSRAGANFFAGRLFPSVLRYSNTILTGTQIASLERYVGSKMGIPL